MGDEGVCEADVHIAAEEQPKAGQEQHNNPKFNHRQKYNPTFFFFLNFRLNFQKSPIFTQILLHVIKKRDSLNFSTVGQPLVTHIGMETLSWPFLALHPLMELLGFVL